MRTGILTRLYECATTAISPFVVAGCALSARGRRRLSERLGDWGGVGDVDWWMHGASVGEVQGLLPLLAEARRRAADSKFLLTSTSPTGLDRGESHVEFCRLLPLDSPLFVRRALSSVRPRRFILAETELWPSLLSELQRRGVSCHIVNGRISDYTVAWYRLVRALFAPLLRNCQSICVSSELQRKRFIELGARPERVHITGHTKFDVEPRVGTREEVSVLRRHFFGESATASTVVTLGSLRPGEEQVWFGCIAHALSCGLPLKVIIAPRHMEKVAYFEEKVRGLGIRFSRWSERSLNRSESPDVVILDVMGMLEEAYAVSSLAFIGGTLVDIGGHNPLEAAMYGVPVVVGPYTSVVAEIVAEMQAEKAICSIATARDVQELLTRVVAHDAQLEDSGVRGREVWFRHRGASKRILAVIGNE